MCESIVRVCAWEKESGRERERACVWLFHFRSNFAESKLISEDIKKVLFSYCCFFSSRLVVNFPDRLWRQRYFLSNYIVVRDASETINVSAEMRSLLWNRRLLLISFFSTILTCGEKKSGLFWKWTMTKMMIVLLPYRYATCSHWKFLPHLSLSYTHTFTLSIRRTLYQTHTHTLSLSLSFSLYHSLSLSLSLSHSLTLSLSHSLTLSLSHSLSLFFLSLLLPLFLSLPLHDSPSLSDSN